jgi:hypothetical protein
MMKPSNTVGESLALPTQQSTTDRRARLRFPLNTELRYQISGRDHGEPIRGIGQAENMSSKGLAFRADKPLVPGLRLKVSMAWPVKLDDKCTLRLVLEGTILRTTGDLVVLTISNTEFRTAGTTTGAAREEIAAMTRYVGTPLGLTDQSPLKCGETRLSWQ